MRAFIAVVAVLLLPLTLFGQKKPKESAQVWLGLHASVRAVAAYGIKVDAWQPGEPHRLDVVYHNHAGNSTSVQSPPELIQVYPGRLYTISIGSANWKDADVHFNVPAGYSLLIGSTNMVRVPMTSFRTPDYNGSFGTHFLDFELRPLDAANDLPAGYALPPQVGDTTWAVSLGSLPGGISAGALRWRSEGLAQSLLDGSSLIYNEPEITEVTVDRYTDEGIKYVGTPQIQIYVNRNAGVSTGYTIEVYRPWEYYTINGSTGKFEFWSAPSVPASPYIKYQISNPETTWQNKVRIVRTQYDVETVVDTWTLSQTATEALLEREGGGRKVRETSVPITGGRQETVLVQNASDIAVSKVLRKYKNYVWGEELIEETVNPDATDGPALKTEYDYYDAGWVNGAFTGSVTKLKSIKHPTGAFEKYEYYDDFARWGQLAKVYRIWKDGAAPATADVSLANATNSVVTTYTYVGERNIFQELPAGTETRVLNTTVAMSTISAPTFSLLGGVYNRWLYGDAKLRTEELRTYTKASVYLASTRKVFHTGSHPDYLGRVYSQTNPDGTKISSSYVRGNYLDYTRTAGEATVFNPSTNGAHWCDTTLYGTSSQVATDSVQYTNDGMTNGASVDPIWLVPNKSIRKQVIRDSRGFAIAELTQVFTGSGFQLVGWESRAYSPEGILTKKHGSDGSKWEISLIGGKTNYETNPDGTQKQHFFDALMRVERTEIKGVAASGSYAAQAAVDTTYQYDAANRVLQEQTTAGGITQTTTKTYNLAGQLKTETNPLGLTTTYGYTNGGRTVTASLPGGATLITDTFKDGSPKSTTGTSTVPSYSGKDFIPSGAESGFLVTKGYALTDGNERFTQVVTDWAGRVIREEKPTTTVGVLFQKVNTYDTLGRLTKVTETGVAPTLFQYNALGEVQFSGLDINGNGTLDLASMDRISEVRTKYINQESAWWLQTLNYTYGTNNNATPKLMGETLVKLVPYTYSGTDYDDGIAKTEARSYDVFRNLTTSNTLLNRLTRLATTTVDVSDSTTNVVKITRNGLVQSEQNAQGLVTKFKYDALRRLTETVDPRTNLSTTRKYYAATAAVGNRHQLEEVKDQANHATTYTYETATGRLASEVNAQSKAVRYSYDIMGRTLRVFGDATYPVEYAYNSYGEQSKMRTFRDTTVSFATTWPYPGAVSADDKGDPTIWNYHPATGLLLSKVSAKTDPADTKNRTVNYTYTARGQLKTRVWARNVTTTYNYDPLTAEQTSITYSDGTPSIVYTYGRKGQNLTVSDTTGSRTFEHCDCGKVTAELLASGFYQGRELHWYLDTTTSGALGRTITLTQSTTGNAATEYSVGFGYDTYGRLNQVGGWTYGYTPSSNLIASVTDVNGVTQSRGYDSVRNLLQSIETKYSTASKAKFVYAHDTLGRRETNTQTGEIFSSYNNQSLVTTWGYNERSEVTSSVTNYATTTTQTSGRNFAYTYDSIGNRATSTRDGVQSSYTANTRNEYSQRAVPNQVAATGFAPATATVTVNAQAAARQGEFFYKTVTAANTSAPAWTAITTASNLGGSLLRNSFVAKTPEVYDYDEDGNLKQDGRWDYVWDAENRLTSMETHSVAYGTGAPRQRLEFKYDYLGRRVQKRVLLWVAPGFSLQSERRFIYDGWNMIADFETSSGYVLKRRFVWGIDLSGSLQDAGGVGGLLSVFDADSNAHYAPAFDGNGNVYALIQRNTGAVKATYEYGSFGELLRSNGEMAQKNPFRFSTKYTDDETGLLYYGFRFYDPTLGRFVGRDPISEKGGLNLFGFCRNNGVNAFDVLGQLEWIWGNQAEGGLFDGDPLDSWKYLGEKYYTDGDGKVPGDGNLYIKYYSDPGSHYQMELDPWLLGYDHYEMYGLRDSYGGYSDPGYTDRLNAEVDSMMAENHALYNPAPSQRLVVSSSSNSTGPAGGRTTSVTGPTSSPSVAVEQNSSANDYESQNAAKYAAAGMEMKYGSVGTPQVLGYESSPGNYSPWDTYAAIRTPESGARGFDFDSGYRPEQTSSYTQHPFSAIMDESTRLAPSLNLGSQLVHTPYVAVAPVIVMAAAPEAATIAAGLKAYRTANTIRKVITIAVGTQGDDAVKTTAKFAEYTWRTRAPIVQTVAKPVKPGAVPPVP